MNDKTPTSDHSQLNMVETGVNNTTITSNLLTILWLCMAWSEDCNFHSFILFLNSHKSVRFHFIRRTLKNGRKILIVLFINA